MKQYILLLTIPLFLNGCTSTISTSPEFLEKNETTNTDFTVVYLEVAPLTKECSGEGIYECIQVREITIGKNGSYIAKTSEWENFYDGIEGYQHNSSESVILKLKAYKVKNPPADGSSVRYVLDEYIQRTPIKNIKN